MSGLGGAGGGEPPWYWVRRQPEGFVLAQAAKDRAPPGTIVFVDPNDRLKTFR
jgi:hypothetical protein